MQPKDSGSISKTLWSMNIMALIDVRAGGAKTAKGVSQMTNGMNEEGGFDPRWDGAFISKDHWHFYRQLLQRYGIVLAPGEFSQIISALKKGTATLIERKSPKQTIHSFRIKSAQERIYVVTSGRHLITTLPPTKRLKKIRRELSAAGRITSETSPP